jgi:hypothetical protein
MQRAAIFFFILFSGSVIFGQSNDSIPKAIDIVEEFYSIYSADRLEYPSVSFEKRKEGWSVVTQRIKVNTLESVDKFLFYDNLQKKYNSLSLERNPERKKIDPEEYLNAFELNNYNVQSYYGYNGWYKDVINEFKDKERLSDDEMNGLARAYSAFASGLISNQYGGTAEDEIWKLSLNMNCLSPAQIDEFVFLETNAQKWFKKLADSNPNFETAVGKIGIKYANEVMVQYTTLLAYANEYASKAKLPADLYSREQLIYAGKLLESCPYNSILFSFGDNDYYPVHYLQKAKGIRRDVYLINYNLISLDHYIFQATQPQYRAKAIKLSVDSSLYSGSNHELIYIAGSPNSIAFKNFIKQLRSGEKDEFGRIKLGAGNIQLKKNKKISVGTTATNETIKISLNDVKYLFKNQWVLLDILENLNGRKISFPNGFDDQLKGLNRYLVRKGDLWMY